MCSLESLRIDLKGLEAAETVCHYDLDDHFFEAIGATDVQRGKFHVMVTVRKSSGMYELLFHIEGTAIVCCSVCLDDVEVPIVDDSVLTARLDEANGVDGDTLVVSEADGILDVSWLIYQTIALCIPIRPVHEEGQCNPEMLRLLGEHQVKGEQATDPRWDALKSLMAEGEEKP